jgi:hypothetical protein
LPAGKNEGKGLLCQSRDVTRVVFVRHDAFLQLLRPPFKINSSFARRCIRPPWIAELPEIVCNNSGHASGALIVDDLMLTVALNLHDRVGLLQCNMQYFCLARNRGRSCTGLSHDAGNRLADAQIID